jgi:ribosome-associated protein
MAESDGLCIVGGGRRVVIPPEALEWRFVRSSGPGGQHVNRTSSKAQLRFHVLHDRHLPADVRERLVALVRHRLTVDGWLVIVGQRHRERPRNIADVRERLAALVRAALVPPPARKRTRVPRGAVAARLETKRHRAQSKRLRRAPDE